ncbi:M10 family metallopeptidase C-terminal domain-containing protein, partial [Alphaproteobacteria bacterium]|nr:M10 family metallopeptidase C-terminal domain-containing protein [Alphaproteobacteria bacterium]
MAKTLTVINTNVGALMARTYAARANNVMTRSMERLSSGQRINSAADDAAGLAVANKMESQGRGIKMAMRNSKDGISLVQTAESAMQEVSNMVLRMRELAVQMDNGVYTSKDRDNAQLEINALVAEIDKIAANTRFNDVALLDGSYDQTIRSGNTNAETTRIRLDSLFAKDNGSGSSITSRETSYGSGPAATTPADFTIEAADLLASRLGISATSNGSLGSTDSETVLSNIVSGADYKHHGGNTLLLKDNVSNLGYSYATVSLTDQQWDEVASNLALTKILYEEIASLDPTASQYAAKITQIGENIAELEVQRSEYIGSLFHANDIDLQGVYVEAMTGNKYAELVNVFSDPDTKQSITGQIAAVEIDFQALTKELHNPRTCAHCIAQASGAAASAPGGSAGMGFTDGFDEDGDRYAAISTNSTSSGSGYASATSPSGGLSSIISGSKWNNVGTDSNGTALSFSYWNGNDDSTSYNYSEGGTRSSMDSHATSTNNSVAHTKVFNEWDKAAAFNFEEITETGSDGNPVGDIRVAILDTMPSGAAAYAYYPSSSAKGGDVYYGAAMMGNATDTDFVEGGYNWYTALHEVGHALGLSHPFDGGAADGSTLNLNLDSQRNTVMTYVQTDRNVRISKSGSSLSIGNKVNISTPGLLDIEAMEHLYGSSGWSAANTATVYGTNAGDGAGYTFNDSYESIKVIADSGGTDTINASSVTTSNIIDLTPGTYSSINYYATDAEKIAAVSEGSASAVTWFTEQVANQDANASAATSHYSGYSRTALYRGQDNLGIAHNTWVENAIGGSGTDTITGNSKGNELTGGGGNDTIDGAGGVDVAKYSGAFANYTITGSASALTVSHNSGGADGVDSLSNVEYLEFSDGVWSIADALASNARTAASLGTLVSSSTTETGGQTGGAANGDGATNIGNLALKDVKIETQGDAQNAVTILNRSLEQIATGRAKLG